MENKKKKEFTLRYLGRPALVCNVSMELISLMTIINSTSTLTHLLYYVADTFQFY